MAVTEKYEVSSLINRLPELTQVDIHALELVRKQGPLSRTTVADLLGKSRSSITSIVGNLLDQGVLVEIGHGESGGGRRPKMLDINKDLGYIAGADIGATSIDLALADFKGNILERVSEPADVRKGPKTVLDEVSKLVCEMLNKRGASVTDLLGFGLGVPGPVQFPAGLLVRPPLMPTWEGFPIKNYLRDRFPASRMVVDNDVNIMAIGEGNVGGGVGMDNFIFIKIGTGIGAGIISHGEIYRGTDGCAGDIGHICVDVDGPVCHCGNTGCLAAMAAGPAIAESGKQAAERGESKQLARRLRENDGHLTSIDVGEVAAAGDPVANQIVSESGQMVGGVLASMVNFYNPKAIFIGGGVSNIGHQYLSTIRQSILHRATALSTRSLWIDYSKLGADAGVYGAIWLAIEHSFSPV